MIRKKLKEFSPDTVITDGKKLQEVFGTYQEVIVHKALNAGKGLVVEDTTFEINGVAVGDIKWKQEDKLKNCQNVCWRVSFGFNDGHSIKVWTGVVNGIIVEPIVDGYGFDPYILPDGYDITVSQLDKEGRKDEVSPRKKALFNLRNREPDFEILISYIPELIGGYK